MRPFVVACVFVLYVNCAISLKCLEGIQEGTCDPTKFSEQNASQQPNSFDVSTFTSRPLPPPESLSMLSEDEHHHDAIFQPTIPPTSTATTNVTDQPKGRALNFTLNEHSHENTLINNSSSHMTEDLSDVTMDDDDEDEGQHFRILTPTKEKTNSTFDGSCEKAGLSYTNGEKLENGCDSICTCLNGQMDCIDRCSEPFFKRGKTISDPLCFEEKVEDPCCSILVCATQTQSCSYKNATYHRGQTFEDGCDLSCSCEDSGSISCRPRCSPITKTSDRCVMVPDPLDSCCSKVLCDVTLDDNEPDKEHEEVTKYKLLSAQFVNASTVKLKFDSILDENTTLPEIEVSSDQSIWKSHPLLQQSYIADLESDIKYIRVKNTSDVIETPQASIDLIKKATDEKKMDKKACDYRGKTYKMGEEFNDNCTSFCVCQENGMKCLKLECPTYFGVDVIDPACIEWKTVPEDFIPSPPNCCPEEVQCKSNGSCDYKGELYQNWQQIPINVTGCEQRCYCEMGKVECQNTCPPVTALPPQNLACPPNKATLSHLPDDDCCMYWVCSTTDDRLGQEENKELPQNAKNEMNVVSLNSFAINATKAPSKVLGPLLVYTNRPDNKTELIAAPEQQNLPNLAVDENHYFTTETSLGKHGHKKKNEAHQSVVQPSKTNRTPEDAVYDVDTQSYRLPAPPDSMQPTNVPFPGTKPVKPSGKSKPSKTNNSVQSEKHTPHENEFVYPPQPNLPFVGNKQPPLIIPTPNGEDIHIHGNGATHDELLEFINHIPELSSYPSGSVLEVHTVPTAPGFKPAKTQFVKANNIHTPTNNGRPYHAIQDSNPPIHDNLPSLEHILQHIHKTPPQPFIPFSPNSNLHSHNGLFVTGHNRPVIPTRPLQNITHAGINGQIFPTGFLPFPPQAQPDDINVHTVEAVDAHTIRLAFTVPPVIVGLHGRVEVRYTYHQNDDENTWELQVFAPPNDLIATSQLEFDLVGLQEDTEYKIKITITLRDLHNTPSSRVYSVKTLKDIAATTLPPMIPIEPELAITGINATWVNVIWRKFTQYEAQFVDGVQLRYKEIDTKIYAATPLIHRAVTSYTLENLQPNRKYEIGIFFIPFPGQNTELRAEHMLHFTTANEIDTYGFNVTLDIGLVKATSVELSWAGVPYPEDKYVNIYRAIYQSDSGKGDVSTFKIAKRDSPSKTTVMDLKPGTRYRLWLEVYLTNGKIKTSNVQDFITKPRTAPVLGSSTQQGKLESGEYAEPKGDYYGPLVIVAILAAIAILSTLILLLILVRRHGQNKACITPPPRVSQSAYDNPTYKVEIQQETMDL